MSNKQRQLAKTQKQSVHVSAAKQELYSGPVPRPDMLEGYEKVVPGSAERMIAMAEKEMSHRHELEDKLVDAEIKDSHTGMIFGFLLGIMSTGAAVLAIVFAPSYAGAIIGGLLGMTGIGSVAGVFIKATRIRNKDNTNN